MRVKRICSLTIAIILIIISVISCSTDSISFIANRDRIFNADWRFVRDSLTGAELSGYDDSRWLVVDLPHDYSIMDLPGEDGSDQIGPFSKNAPGNGNSAGHVLGGTGWYRKSFALDRADIGKTVVLKFDGVYMETEVWVNGKKAGIHKNGYTPFWFDITDLLNEPGKTNVVAVKVDNTGRNSRWYSGSGIYRNVHLMLTNPVHIGVWGAYITTPEINPNLALVDVAVTVQNERDEKVKTHLKINIKDKDGKITGTTEEEIELKPKSVNTIKKQIKVDNPLLWSLESPNLYKAEMVLAESNRISDIYNQEFGIRTIEFTAEKGFLLNGEPVLLKGGGMHHDNGLLGSAAFDRAEYRRVEIMKSNGFNAIRCAHNPPSESFLNACDKLGMLVIDEFTDMWDYYKNPQDYSRFFNDWWNKDLTDFVMRDRNHPSIIMWSIGNEINIKSMDNYLRIAKELSGRVRELDNTRAVTQAITGFFFPDWETTAKNFELLDVCGYNYLLDKLGSDHEKYPKRVMFMSESYTKSAYDSWKAVEKYPYVIGDFIWTSWDYLGEGPIGTSRYIPKKPASGSSGNFDGFKLPKDANVFDFFAKMPSAWPNYIANCADIDITGEKKPQMLYRDVIWDNSKLEINVHEPIPEGFVEAGSNWAWPLEMPSWNWPGNEGKSIQVRVFTKDPEVRLELNGKVIGEKALSDSDKYIAVFDVPYQPGELKAIAYKDGKEIAVKSLTTPGKPVAIRLTADRNTIHADRNDLSFVKIEVVDENGQVVPTNDVKIELSISGNGELIASGNASNDGMESFHKPIIKLFRGLAQAIIRPYTKSGEIIFTAKGENLVSGELKITVN